MNKKKLALEVFNTSEIKKIASLESVDKAALIRMIAEEATLSSIEEAMTPEQKKVNSSIQNYLTRKLAKNPDQWVQAVKDANNGTLAISGFDQLDDELKKFAIQKFFAASRTKEYLAQQAANIAQTKDVPAEEAAKAVLDLAAPEQATPEAAEELASLVDADADAEAAPAIEIKPLLDRFATFIQRTGLINEETGEVLAALNIKDPKQWQESYFANFSEEEREALDNHFDDDANGELFFKQYFSTAPEFLERFRKLIAGEEEEKPSAVEIKPLLDRFATFIQRTGVLNEKINYVIQALDLKDTKVFGKSFAQNFNREEIETLKSHFEDTENGALFFKQYFSQDPEFLERFNQALAGEEEPEGQDANCDLPVGDPERGKYGEDTGKPCPPGEEPEKSPAEEVMDIPEGEIVKLSEAYNNFVSDFMRVKTLIKQSMVFGDLWGSIKIFAGKQKSDLEQAQRAINFTTASKEEDEEARRTVSEAEGDDLFSDEVPENTPEDEAAADRAMETEPEGEEGGIPQEAKEEFKRNVLERLLVLKRHSDQIADVLVIYDDFKGKLTQGSVDAFRKYGESDPKALLYKLVNLLMKDINGLLQVMETLQPQEKGLAEALLEVEGEKFADKLRNVKAVNDFVVGETKVLLSIVQNKQQAAPTEEPAPEAEEEEKAELQEQDTNKAIAAREKAIQIYDEMAKIKKYFPTVQPLDSEHQLSEVIDGFANVIKIIKDHIATMTRFKDDKNINPSSLESARDGLLTIKKVIMDLFGVADEGKIEAPAEDVASINPTGKTAIEDEGMKEPTEVEVEWDEEDEAEDEYEEGKLAVLNNLAQIERHMNDRFLPPKMFKEVFAKNEALMADGGKPLERAFDAFTLFFVLTKTEDTEGQPLAMDEQPLQEAAGDDPGSEIWDELDDSYWSGEEEGGSEGEAEIDLATIIRKARILDQLKVDGERIKEIVYKVINVHFKEKSRHLSEFFDKAETGELRVLNKRLEIQEGKYPFKVVMDNVGTFIKTYADDEAFEPDEETPTGEPEGAPPEEPAGEEPTGEPEEDSAREPTPVEVEVDEEALEALLAQADEAIQTPEVQQKIEDLPDSGPELASALGELTVDILSGNEWLDVEQEVDLSLPDINLEPKSPEAKQAVVDAVKADIEEKRPEIDLSGIDVDSLPELEPDMDEPAKIDMPDSPREIRRQAFNRKIRALKKKAQGRFDIGKVAKVLRDILNVRNINLSEGYTGGLEVKTLQDLHRALVDAEAIGKDEHSMDTAKLVADMMADLGIEFPDANEKRDIEEQLTTKLTPIIKEILNRTNNG